MLGILFFLLSVGGGFKSIGGSIYRLTNGYDRERKAVLRRYGCLNPRECVKHLSRGLGNCSVCKRHLENHRERMSSFSYSDSCNCGGWGDSCYKCDGTRYLR